jgi:hypothetical protein
MVLEHVARQSQQLARAHTRRSAANAPLRLHFVGVTDFVGRGRAGREGPASHFGQR